MLVCRVFLVLSALMLAAFLPEDLSATRAAVGATGEQPVQDPGSAGTAPAAPAVQPKPEGTPAAQSDPATTSGPAAQQTPMNPKEAAEKWVSAKGWKLGARNGDGSFVAIGLGDMDPSDKRGALSRELAFLKASLDAKNSMARFMSTKISAIVKETIREGSVPADKLDGLPRELVEKIVAKMKARPGGANDEFLNGSDFKAVVQSLTRAELCGLVASQTFEGTDRIAVVMRHTPTSRALCDAAMGRGTAPRNAALAEIDEWAQKATREERYSTFGVKLFRKGASEVCIGGFGQGDVIGKSANAEKTAHGKAISRAELAIRLFVGEYLFAERLLAQTVDFAEYKEAGVVFESAEAYVREMESVSAGLDFGGLEDVLPDLSGQVEGKMPVVGVLQMWSVSGSDVANKMRKEIEAVGGSTGGSGRRNSPPATAPSDGGAPADRKFPPITPGNKGPEVPEP
jgi:hypothetical protein